MEKKNWLDSAAEVLELKASHTQSKPPSMELLKRKSRLKKKWLYREKEKHRSFYSIKSYNFFDAK